MAIPLPGVDIRLESKSGFKIPQIIITIHQLSTNSACYHAIVTPAIPIILDFHDVRSQHSSPTYLCCMYANTPGCHRPTLSSLPSISSIDAHSIPLNHHEKSPGPFFLNMKHSSTFQGIYCIH